MLVQVLVYCFTFFYKDSQLVSAVSFSDLGEEYYAPFSNFF
ncbi:hypothetical protein SLEP1_g53869 [Rubroshorea leprosula]|uniref:Uncharacterized protein n=1 Tax=Rubroshorea leprosula TaxID=152421 RepID=A0AAV5MAV0_9ROSI|nr:hypothetical protein SLEP1_g53869 [Rubroshorea leprosula]